MPLPQRQVSLNEYYEVLNELYAREASVDFVKAAVCGILDGYQSVVDVEDSRVSNNPERLTLSRDIDSVIGISSTLLPRTYLTLYPLADFHDTLQTSVHINHTFVNDQGEFNIPLHHIPNLCGGAWGTRSCFRFFFPDLVTDQRQSHHITVDEQATFYNLGLRPTLAELLEDRAVDIPPDFESLQFRAQGENGTFSFTTKILPRHHVPYFIPALRRALVANGVPWGRNLFVVHEIRGIKNSTYHLPDPENAEVALDDFLDRNHINLNDIREDIDVNFSSRWFIDIGLEISATSKRCLAWICADHRRIVSDLCGVDQETAARITAPNAYRGYSRDILGHFVDLAGFRLEPGASGRGDFDLQYMQCYTTEKGLLDRKDGTAYSKKLTVAKILKGKHGDYLDKLYHTFIAASDRNPSSARVEVRVPFEHACRVLVDLPMDTLQNALAAIHPTVYWGTRAYKTVAVHELLDWYKEAPVDLQVLKPSVSLMIGLSWWVNALHSTYDDRNYSRELISTILPHHPPGVVMTSQLPFRTSLDVGDGNVGRTVPCMPFGMICLDLIRIGPGYPCPRMSDPGQKPCMSPEALEHFLGVPFHDFVLNVKRSKLTAPRDKTRTRNRTVQLKRITPPDQPPPPVIFDLNPDVHAFLPPIRDDGSDIEVDSDGEDSDPGGGQPQQSVNHTLTTIWGQFLVDMAETSPNQRGASSPPYILLTPPERLNVTVDLYRDSRLTLIFRDFMWRRADKARWRENFNRLFPSKGPVKGRRVQNYNNTAYYPMWVMFGESTTDETFVAARKEIWRRVCSLYWLPATESDRIWSTRIHPKFKKTNGRSPNKSAPHILVYGFGQPR
ncbi:hypothetical protein EST38_g12577 [Candolleomyces aberdarensis]|uniref:Uncharacterized protein n=1 Tax=Candolleomyces aberdarensis TaxID=2316362 RepID=A0A4V1Q1Z2_9AGAR|nr:hypothetical protein EST38_g12577 [Candolleomyces aberdarensis]